MPPVALQIGQFAMPVTQRWRNGQTPVSFFCESVRRRADMMYAFGNAWRIDVPGIRFQEENDRKKRVSDLPNTRPAIFAGVLRPRRLPVDDW
jgi:hypothetical protein